MVAMNLFLRKDKLTTRMKIVFLIRSLNYGGAERQLITLASGLKKMGHEVIVVVFYRGGELEEDLKEMNVKFYCLDKLGRWDIFPFIKRLIQLLKLEKPDILHSYLDVPNLLSVMFKPFFPDNTKIIWGVRASNTDLDHYDWLTRLTFHMNCCFSRFADLIIVNSNAGHAYHLAHGYSGDKMIIVQNGINTAKFFPSYEARLQLRAEWGISEKEILIGLVARLDPMKDHLNFLKASTILLRERKDIRIICIGDGPMDYRQKLYGLSIKLKLEKRLLWVEGRKDMNAVYNAIDIICSSSSWGEGFPNVIGEAMACGVPCVATDAGDSAFIVSAKGIVVPPQNPQALANGLMQMLQNFKKNQYTLRKQVRFRITSQFSHESLVLKTAATFKNLL